MAEPLLAIRAPQPAALQLASASTCNRFNLIVRPGAFARSEERRGDEPENGAAEVAGEKPGQDAAPHAPGFEQTGPFFPAVKAGTWRVHRVMSPLAAPSAS